MRMSATHMARWMLILGTSFVFAYFGIVKFTNPDAWILWMPEWLDGQLSLTLVQWMHVTAVIEIIIAAALLFPVRIVQRISALLAALHLTAILTQVGWNDTAVRDIGLLMMTTALWYLLKDDRVVK
jgi:uncharacterized membrane protein